MARLLGLSVLYGIPAVLITSANVLIILVFSRRKLRQKRSNLLLLGLAVVDLLVGSVAVPLLIAVNLNSSVYLRSAHFYVDIITGLASIFSLAVISLERMYAVCWPFRHRTLGTRIYIFATCVPWILVIAGTVTAELASERVLTSVLISLSMVMPLIIICILYCVIWKKQRRSSLQHRSVLQEVQEKKLAKTLLIIIGAFIVTWLPFQVLNIYVTACKYFASCEISRIPAVVFYITVVLRLSNSFVNFLVYSLRMPDFRECLRKMFPLCRDRIAQQEQLHHNPVPAHLPVASENTGSAKKTRVYELQTYTPAGRLKLQS